MALHGVQYLHKLDPEIPIDDSKIILANWDKSGESQFFLEMIPNIGIGHVPDPRISTQFIWPNIWYVYVPP